MCWPKQITYKGLFKLKKNRLIGSIVVLLSLVLVLAGCASNSGNKSSSNSSKKIVTFATTGVSYPTSYKSNGKLTGFDVDVATAAAKKIGYTAKFKTTSFDGLFGQLSSGKVDAVANMVSITPQRERQYYFSKPYGYFTYAIAVSKKSKLTNINQLSGKTLAVVTGSNQIEAIKALNPKIKLRTFDDRDSAINAVTTGQVDGYCHSSAILASTIKQKNLPLKILKGRFDSQKVGFAFAKNAAGKKLAKKFNTAIDKLQRQGKIAKISKQYFSGLDASQK
ncbi:ABC transporter substrate-binding protein [Secundilactobacillus paracollinoides]|uniref:ABC transporter substrate-binding protein n=1 Tax=Secundilactobacillus paracollinoides TaxID=240427 RepID=A0A1B2IY48_9LACO|nr:ABC transporter substrate-binding protein [Secundilactobacillus paracollinoides]ANZ66963.1 ABC transporter substrate-binding protein [Secundilactobacillus paracollinoides]